MSTTVGLKNNEGVVAQVVTLTTIISPCQCHCTNAWEFVTHHPSGTFRTTMNADTSPSLPIVRPVGNGSYIST